MTVISKVTGSVGNYSGCLNTTPALPSRTWPTNLWLPYGPQCVPTSAFPNTSGYTTTAVSAGTLQTAINNASCSPTGTILTLSQGQVENGGSTSYTLPNKTCAPGQWIIITTAGLPLPAQGTRIDPSSTVYGVGVIGKITSSATDCGTICVNAPSSFYWLSGLEIESTNGSSNVVTFGNYEHIFVPSDLPHDLVLDRCYVHAKAATNNPEIVRVYANNVTIEDSYLSEAHSQFNDSQAIEWPSGGGDLISNNFLEGAGENTLAEGNSNAVFDPPYDIMVHDVTFKLNFSYKPQAWNPGSPLFMGITRPVVKNLWELKNGVRWSVTDNVMMNWWSQGQTTDAVLMQPIIGLGPNPTAIHDINFSFNKLVHVGGFLTLAGCNPGWCDPHNVGMVHAGYQKRVLVQNNETDDVDPVAYQGEAGVDNFTMKTNGATTAWIIDHNTLITSVATNADFMSLIFMADGSGFDNSRNFYFTGNVAQITASGQGFSGDSFTGSDNGAINAYFSSPPLGAIATSALISANCAKYVSWPTITCPAAASNVGFVNYNGGVGGDYRLCTGLNLPAAPCAGASSYAAGQANGCTDLVTGAARDCGADIAGLNAAIAGVQQFPANWPTSITLSPSSIVCNGSNTTTASPVGVNFNITGLEALVGGVVQVPSVLNATTVTVTPPSFSHIVASVNTFACTSTKCTFGTTAPHGMTIGMSVTVTGLSTDGGVGNGTWQIIALPTTSSFIAGINVPDFTQASDTGTATVSKVPVTIDNFGLPLTALLTCQ